MKQNLRLAAAFAVMNALQALVFTCPAFAFHGDFGTSPIAMRQETRTVTAQGAPLVRVEGKLKCDLGSTNTGESCTLKLEESKSGKIYTLLESNEAMRLYQSGSRSVVIEGTVAAGGEAIQVNKAQTL